MTTKHNYAATTSETVKVIVRCRPLNKKEKDLKCTTVVDIDQSVAQVNLSNPSDPEDAPPKTFTFDGAYGTTSTTEEIYNEIVFPLIESVTEGYNGTVFAYGQTGCGKSFSMQGTSSPATQRGIIPRSFEHIFEAIATTENTRFLVQASYLEIYNEEIRDLLGEDPKRRLELKENPETGIYVAGLTLHSVHNVVDCEQVMQYGWQNRSVGATLMNADSSRSHSIFTVYIEKMDLSGRGTESVAKSKVVANDGKGLGGGSGILKGKLNLVDLAGSERQAKTGATGDRLKEANKINLSLSALGNVISALIDGKSKHIPYRDSKLTRLLQDSLGGNTKTLMIACLSPANYNYDESLSTLRYANRAKNIKNKPKINEDPKDALLRQYQEEIERLKSLVQQPSNNSTGNNIAKAIHLSAAGQSSEGSIAQKLKENYDHQMKELTDKYKMEHESNVKLKEEMDRLRANYEAERQRVTDGGEDDKETLERLQHLQKDVVIGGEKAHDVELKERRAKRMRNAQRRMNAISEALSKFDDDDQLLVKAYGDMTEELRAKSVLLKKAKKKIQTLERDIEDLQSEFESERSDYLESIRSGEKTSKLLAQLLEKVSPCIRKDCNYANIERIRSEAFWDDDLQKWRLPELVVSRVKLPAPAQHPPQVRNGQRNGNTTNSPDSETSQQTRSPESMNGVGGEGLEPQDTNGYEPPITPEPAEDRLLQRLELGARENIAQNYFKTNRREQMLLNRFNQANHTATNVFQNGSPASETSFRNGNNQATRRTSSLLINNNNNPLVVNQNHLNNLTGHHGLKSKSVPGGKMFLSTNNLSNIPATQMGGGVTLNPLDASGGGGGGTYSAGMDPSIHGRKPARLEALNTK